MGYRQNTVGVAQFGSRNAKATEHVVMERVEYAGNGNGTSNYRLIDNENGVICYAVSGANWNCVKK